MEEKKTFEGRYRPISTDEYKQPSNGISGFYYDCQLEDPFLSITLHANTKRNEQATSETNKWIPWPAKPGDGNELDKNIICLPAISGSAKFPDPAACYGAEPLARCILSDDFSYSIANEFTDNNMGNAIESAFNSFKPYAPILGKIGQGIGPALKNVANQNSFGSSVVGAINGFLEKANISDKLLSVENYLNKSLFVQGTRYVYYGGTQFNFNNLEMKFLVFSDYVRRGDNWVFQSVEDYIETLQPYVMGEYNRGGVTNFLKEGTGIDLEEKAKEEDNKWAGPTKEWLDTYAGFQSAPGGFHMDTKNLDNTLKGTLRLNIGGTWAIDNLVLKNMNVVMSRVQAKHPEKPGETVPLYAEVVLQLAPACVIIDGGYKRIIQHKGLESIRSSVANGYVQSLENLKKNYVPASKKNIH